ncbi:helix-turn-helix domain-containing protein [Enterococcus faecalis]|uniref:helix-turn-helix domain-containing protein n=1 Tax=Enterococcus faecalis TaxID=1351 RepID=UPI003A97A0A5
MSKNFSDSTLLKSLRQERKMSQKKLAELAGISQSALAKYEKGTRNISNELDSALSKVLNVDTLLQGQTDELMTLINQLLSYQEINNLSNKELALKIGIDEASLSRVFNGKHKPSKADSAKIYCISV